MLNNMIYDHITSLIWVCITLYNHQLTGDLDSAFLNPVRRSTISATISDSPKGFQTLKKNDVDVSRDYGELDIKWGFPKMEDPTEMYGLSWKIPNRNG